MKTQGEIESALSDGMSRFEQEYMGAVPRMFALTLAESPLFRETKKK